MTDQSNVDAQTINEIAAAVAQPQTQTQRTGIRVWEVVAISSTAATVVFFALLWAIPHYSNWWPRDEARPIFFLDGQLIVQSKLAAIQRSPETAAGVGEAFAKALDAYIARLSQQGAIVLNKRAAIAYPPAIDITEQAAKDLQVVIVRDDVRSAASTAAAAVQAPTAAPATATESGAKKQ